MQIERIVYVLFLFFFTYLAVEGTATFLTIIVSSVIGRCFVAAHSIVYNMFIRLVSLGNHFEVN